MTTPEFSRAYALDTLGEPRAVAIAATDGERAALSIRFGLLALETLEAQATLTRDGPVVSAVGRLRAAVVQACVASGAELPRTVDEPFTLRFVPAVDEMPDDEIEIAEESLDDMAYDGQAIDLGEAVAQTLALALDPFPRSPDADAILRKAGVLREDDLTPLSPLAGLRDLLGQ